MNLVSPLIKDDSKHSKYLNLLSKIATDIEQPVRSNSRLAACVVYRGDVISVGINQLKSHPFQARYAKNFQSVYLHAETGAIKNALKNISLDELSRSTLYVARVKFRDEKKTGLTFGLSKPCPGCLRCIVSFGIKNVVYTLDDDQGFEIYERVLA